MYTTVDCDYYGTASFINFYFVDFRVLCRVTAIAVRTTAGGVVIHLVALLLVLIVSAMPRLSLMEGDKEHDHVVLERISQARQRLFNNYRRCVLGNSPVIVRILISCCWSGHRWCGVSPFVLLVDTLCTCTQEYRSYARWIPS
jgi:hypothetical protein